MTAVVLQKTDITWLRISVVSFSSYCPIPALPSEQRSGLGPCCFSSLPAAHEEEKAGSEATGFFQISLSEYSDSETQSALAPPVILDSFCPVMNKVPYVARRTSCVLWPPRILTDARCPQHACKVALPPLTPTKERASPLCWILPRAMMRRLTAHE